MVRALVFAAALALAGCTGDPAIAADLTSSAGTHNVFTRDYLVGSFDEETDAAHFAHLVAMFKRDPERFCDTVRIYTFLAFGGDPDEPITIRTELGRDRLICAPPLTPAPAPTPDKKDHP